MNFATTMHIVSWSFYNEFFKVLLDYHLVYLPLLIFLWQDWLSLMNNDSNNTLVTLSIKRMLISAITYYFIYILAFYPTIPLTTVDRYMDSYKGNTTIAAYERNLLKYTDRYFPKTEQQGLKMPVAWAAWTSLNTMINYAFLKAMPKSTDENNSVRAAMATFLKESNIRSPETKTKFNTLYNDCYQPAKAKFNMMVNSRQIKVDTEWQSRNVKKEDYDWVGGHYFVENKGFYKQCLQNDTACQNHPVTPGGFKLILDQENIMYCDAYWLDEVRPLLIKEFKLEASRSRANSMIVDMDQQIRAHLQSNQRNYVNYAPSIQSQESTPWDLGITHFIKTALVTIGAWMAEIVIEIITTVIVAFLPIGQIIMLAVFVIFMPIVLLIAALRFEILVAFLMYYFAFSFLTVIWAIVAFIDDNLMAMFLNTETGSFLELVSKAVSHLSITGSLISIATSFLYYQATTKWFKLIGMAGAKGSDEARTAMGDIKGVTDTIGESSNKAGKNTKSIVNSIRK